MGLREDVERYRAVGEERRQDLADFIRYGDLGASRADAVRIPVKIGRASCRERVLRLV